MPAPAVRLALLTPIQTSDLLVREVHQQGYHRVQMTQTMRTLGVNQQRMTDVLTRGFQAHLTQQRVEFDRLNAAVEHVGEEIRAGFEESCRFLGQIEQHLSNISTSVAEILELLVDKDAYLRRKKIERQLVADRDRLLAAKSEFSEGLKLLKEAGVEPNRLKLEAMLREAKMLLEQAAEQPALALDAKVFLGSLLDSHFGDGEGARRLYEEALGQPFSKHHTRVSLLLADLEYRLGHDSHSLARLRPCIDRFFKLEQLAGELQAVRDADWAHKEQELVRVIKKHEGLLGHTGLSSSVLKLVEKGRTFSAAKAIDESGDMLVSELMAARPDLDIFFHAARSAARLGERQLAIEWLNAAYDRSPTTAARRLLFLEAEANRGLWE